MQHFQTLEKLPEDPILGIAEEFKSDKRPYKINLGVGTYKDAEGHPFVLPSVREAEKQILNKKFDKEYLPISGYAPFIQHITTLILNQEKDRLSFGAQTVGATGAIRLGADLFSRSGIQKVFLSDPSWSNHKEILTLSGLNTDLYPYYDSTHHHILLDEMLEAIEKMPENSAILLQVTCHNPTGFDPTLKEWEIISQALLNRKILPFFDFAYHGLGTSLQEDSKPIEIFASHGHPMLVAYSCSKNFGLYGERVGALLCINFDQVKEKITSQIKNIIRGSYSTPPLQGARIVTTILESTTLRGEWEQDLNNVQKRLSEMRSALASELLAKGPSGQFEYMHRPKGFFCLTGLNDKQVSSLKIEKGIYMPLSGRINIAGLNWHNMEYFLDSFLSIL